MATKDPLCVLDAIYAFERDEKAWLTGLCDAFFPYDLGRGVAAYVTELGRDVRVRAIASRELRIPEATVFGLSRVLPKKAFRRIHAPLPASYGEDIFPSDAPSRWTEIVRGALVSSLPNAWAISGGDARHSTVLVVFHCKGRDDLASRDRAVLDQLGAHLGSALRLRALHARAPVADDHAVEAIFAPDGRVLDLKPNAGPERETLVDAVRRSERAKLRDASPEERLELWTALVEGRWSIIERTDRDGKRMMLACRNEPRTMALRALTERERSVAEYASLGHPYKYIAYELGVAISTVGADLDSALKKLGVSSRTELVGLFADAT